MQNSNISANLEDYLEFIYNSIQEKSFVKAVEIAKEFNISRPSVTEALQKLEQKGYIIYGRYQPIELTQQGVDTAKEIILKHDILCKFFTSVLELPEEEASKNACKIEHVITPVAFQKIKEYLTKNSL